MSVIDPGSATMTLLPPAPERGPAPYYCFDVCVDGEVVADCVLFDDEGIAAFLGEVPS